MIRKPNVFQKLFHRFFMVRPVTAFFAPRVHHIDTAMLKMTRGKFALCELLGWNIIQLTTIGAKTGQPRTMPLIGMFDRQKVALIASNFGRKCNPGWYYNLKAHSECVVQLGGRRETYLAHEAIGEEYDLYWQMAVSFYAGYEKYQQRALPRQIPVIVLEPKG
jgi:deazaflavin-dependent oxidoreductase (nitroreductase family)